MTSLFKFVDALSFSVIKMLIELNFVFIEYSKM